MGNANAVEILLTDDLFVANGTEANAKDSLIAYLQHANGIKTTSRDPLINNLILKANSI